jgi:tight adherence protein B
MEIIALPLLVFSAVAAIALALLNVAFPPIIPYRSRLNPYDRDVTSVSAVAVTPESILRTRDYSGVKALQAYLSTSSYADKVALDLAEANIPLRVGEFLLLRALVAVAFTLPVPIGGLPPFVAIPLMFFGWLLPGVYVARRQSQRLAKFNDTLVDALTMMANALKSGSSFLQALDLVAQELTPPLSEEFGRVVAEVSIGTPVEEALQSLSRRVKSYDLYLTVTAMLVQRETGGNLAEVLESISYTIRERVRLLRQVDVLTAQERMSSYVVGALPVAALAGFSLITPGYINPFLQSIIGQVMLGMAFVLEVIGFFVMARVAKIEV